MTVAMTGAVTGAVAAGFLMLAAGDASAQTDAVRVVGDRSFLTDCAKLGDVQGSSLMGIILENEGWENAVGEMKERALALGGTHLLLQRVDRSLTGSRGAGEVYGCPLQPEPPAQRGRRRNPR